MTDERLGDEADWNPSSFEEWLAHVAEAEGVSEQEVLDQMMSSYWILDELTELMDESRGEDPPDEREGDTALQSGAEGDAAADTEEFRQLFEVMSQFAEASTQSPPPGETSDRIDAELDRIRNDLDRLTTRIDALVDQGRLAGGSTQGGSSQRPGESAELASDVEALSRRVDDLAAGLEDVESRQHTLQSNVDDNFSHVEDILQYVVEELDAVDARTEDVTEELSAVRSDVAGREQLRELKRQANVKDVETARCEHCGETVRIALLARAACPNCDRPLDGITAASGLTSLFRKPVLTVASRKSTDTSRSDGARETVDSSDRRPDQSVSRDRTDSDDAGSMDLDIGDVLEVDDDESHQ